METLQSLEEIYFPVEKKLISDWAPGFEGVGSKTHVILTSPNGSENVKAVNFCADRYNLKPNKDIFPHIEEILTRAGLKYTVKVQHVDFAKFFVEFIIKDKEFTIGSGKDVVFPRIIAEHSYNGEMDYNLLFGWFRLVCSNGLVVPATGKENDNFFAKGKHTPSMEESFSKLAHFVNNFTENAKDTLKRYDVLTDRMVVDYADRLEEVINFMAKGTRLPKKILEPAIDTVAVEMEQLNMAKANDWLVYNAINKHLYSNEENKIQNHIRMDIDQKVLQHLIANPFKSN